MRGLKNRWFLPAMIALAVACTQSPEDSTAVPTPRPAATRSIPVQPPANPFDLVATIFPAPTPTEFPFLPTPFATATTYASNIFRSTPTPLSAAPTDQVLFDVGGSESFQVFDGESLWFADGPFAKRFSMVGELQGTFPAAASEPPQLAFAAGHIWALDAAEGQLHKMTLGGEILKTIPINVPTSMAVGADAVWVYSRVNARMNRYGFEGELIGSFNLDARVFTVSHDRVWAWNSGLLSAYSFEGNILSKWSDLEFIQPVSEIQISVGYAWLFGAFQTHFLRLDTGSGAVAVFELELNDGEFVPFIANVGGLVLEDSIWVAYLRTTTPPNQPGAVSSAFRRLEIFDFERNVLASIDLGGQLFDTDLGLISPIGEVWMLLERSPFQALFQRFKIADFVPVNSTLTPE